MNEGRVPGSARNVGAEGAESGGYPDGGCGRAEEGSGGGVRAPGRGSLGGVRAGRCVLFLALDALEGARRGGVRAGVAVAMRGRGCRAGEIAAHAEQGVHRLRVLPLRIVRGVDGRRLEGLCLTLVRAFGFDHHRARRTRSETTRRAPSPSENLKSARRSERSTAGCNVRKRPFRAKRSAMRGSRGVPVVCEGWEERWGDVGEASLDRRASRSRSRAVTRSRARAIGVPVFSHDSGRKFFAAGRVRALGETRERPEGTRARESAKGSA